MTEVQWSDWSLMYLHIICSEHYIEQISLEVDTFLTEQFHLYCSYSQCFNNRVDSVYAVMLTASWLLPDSGRQTNSIQI